MRTDESYPGGRRYVWEPALHAVHADSNALRCLIFDGVTRTNDDFGRELTRIKMHDPAYPLEVTLNFCADLERDVIEQWTEVVHRESGAVTLEHMASSALLLSPRMFI